MIGKWILSEFPHPMTLTLVQLIAITLLSPPLIACLQVRQSPVSKKHYWRFIIPLAGLKFISNVFAHISIWKVPVSYAHTVKASLPLFTVFFTRVFLGETYSAKTYGSLLVIVSGVAIATVSTTRRTTSPAANGSGWRSPERSCIGRRSFSPTTTYS